MPVQDNSGKPRGWSTKVLVSVVAIAMAIVWIIASAVSGGGKANTQSEIVDASKDVDVTGPQGVWNSTLGVSRVVLFHFLSSSSPSSVIA